MNQTKHTDFIRTNLCNLDDKFWVLFRALGDCARYRIAKVLLRHRNVSVSELAEICEISVPAVSQHLRILKDAGLVTCKRKGRTAYYELDESTPYVARIIDLIGDYLKAKEL